MIKYNPKEWFGLIFRFHKSDTFRKMFWVLVVYAFSTGALVYLELHVKGLDFFANGLQIHSLLGFVIGLLLVFRTNSAYDRWWEGRKQWGALVNSSRNAALKFQSALQGKPNEQLYYATGLKNYSIALRDHLREGANPKLFIGNQVWDNAELENKKHVPNAIAKRLHLKTQDMFNQKEITGEQLIVLHQELKDLTDITGACERIRNTPIPFSYNLFIKKFIFAYTLSLPLSLAFNFEYWSVPISTFILYIFGSLELLAEEIEEPFGLDASDLPTDEITAKIVENIDEIFE